MAYPTIDISLLSQEHLCRLQNNISDIIEILGTVQKTEVGFLTRLRTLEGRVTETIENVSHLQAQVEITPQHEVNTRDSLSNLRKRISYIEENIMLRENDA